MSEAKRYRILVIHYSQSGQLNQVARSVMSPLMDKADVEVVWHELKPVIPFPFPWPLLKFFDTFPECIYMDPPPLQRGEIDGEEEFDLVILAYQVWFLAPALPVTAFLQSDQGKRVLRAKPVVTLIGCRNMWISAQEKMAGLVRQAGAYLVDNIVLVDQGPPWATFITTPRWVLTGKKNGFWGIFPPAGISEQEINAASRFGRALYDALPLIQSGDRGPFLAGLAAVKVYPGYIAGERLAQRSFVVWGRLLRALGLPGSPVRRLVLVVYILFLILLILTVMPLGIIIRAMLRPLMREKLERQVRRLEAPSGSSTERMKKYGTA